MTDHDAEIKKALDAMRGIIEALDPAGEIKVTRTEALEFWDRARIANRKVDKGKGVGGMIAYRHGDLAFIEVSQIPNGLTKSESRVLMTGSGGHDHTYSHGEFYPHQDELIIGYLVANNRTRLYHLEHGKMVKETSFREAKIAAGTYELRKQQEDTNDGMKPVVD